MATFYVSDRGNDGNTGQSPSSPWKTIERANQSTYLFKPGDSIVFRANGEYHGTLYPGGGRSLYDKRLTIGYYGDGDRPVLSGYKTIKPAAWVNHSEGVWKVNINDATKYTGNPQAGVQGANVGFLEVDDVIHGAKRWALGELLLPWDFYSDEVTWLYVRCDINPASLAGTIRASIGERAVFCEQALRVLGLEITGYSGHGLSGSSLRAFEASGNLIHRVGGGRLVSASGNTRYGNGVEAWRGSMDVVVEGNEIANCYDTATTMQGTMATPASGWDDVWFVHNTIWECTQSFEIWAAYDDVSPGAAGSGFHHCGFDGNVCLNAGGWGAAVRPDAGKAAHLLIYGISVPDVDVSVRRNVFNGAENHLFVRSNSGDTLPSGYVFDSNQVFLRADQPIFDKSPITATNWPQFVSDFGLGTKNTCDMIFANDPATFDGAMQKAAECITASGASALSSSRSITSLFAKAARNAGDIGGILESPGFKTFRTARSSTITDNWALMLTVQATNYGKSPFNAIIQYTVGGDSSPNRNSAGFISLQIVPDAGLTVNGTYVDIDVVELLAFRTGLAASDFSAVVTGTEGAVATVRLYVNIGKDNYASLYFRPLIAMSETGEPGLEIAPSTFQFSSNAGLIAALPAGRTLTATTNDEAFARRELTGAGAPTTPPARVGLEYLDLTARKAYRAFGTTSYTDWVALN